MQFNINPAEEVPIYRQIVSQITDAIAGGRLKPNEKLPSHRDLAETLVIAPLTVKKAYDVLEGKGHIQTLRGRGTFVAGSPPSLGDGEKMDQLRLLARRLLRDAWLTRVPYQKVLKILNEEMKRLEKEQKQSLKDPK